MPDLSSHAGMNMPVHVIQVRQPGPVFFVSAASHGDELNGVDIIMRWLATKVISTPKGTLATVPHFCVPVPLNVAVRDGSLRGTASDMGFLFSCTKQAKRHATMIRPSAQALNALSMWVVEFESRPA